LAGIDLRIEERPDRGFSAAVELVLDNTGAEIQAHLRK